MPLVVRFAPEAIADLQAIYDYIALRGGTSVARDYVAGVYDHCRGMATFPIRGVARDDLWPGLRLVGYRRRATIAIEVRPDELRILRILAHGRDVESAFEA